MSTRLGNAGVGLVAALICLGLVVAACGGSSSSGATGSEASAGFIKKGHVNVLPKFGKEAPEEEREEVSSIVSENLKARAAGDFATQCKTLGAKGMAEVPGAKNQQSCAKALKKLAEPLSESKGIRKNTLDGSISALRVKGNKGWALYHGNDGKDYAVPMEKEAGSWKVGSIVTTLL
jgi:hypothetical protein